MRIVGRAGANSVAVLAAIGPWGLAACGAERMAAPVDAAAAGDAAPALIDAAAVTQPSGCAHTITLVGAVTPSPATIGPVAIDATGMNVCLDLDATALARAHFMGGTTYEPGPASSFVATLQRPDHTTIQDGWDLTVDTPPRSMMTLEWSPPARAHTPAVLWVRARSATATTTVDLALFDPLE